MSKAARLLGLFLTILLLHACSSTGQNNKATPTPVRTPLSINSPAISTPTTEVENVERSYSVYFLTQNPPKDTLESMLTPYNRKTTRKDVITFLLEELLLGLTKIEQNTNVFNALELWGAQNTEITALKIDSREEARKLFTVSITDKKAKVNFLGKPFLEGDLSGAYIKLQIEKTLVGTGLVTEVMIAFDGTTCWNDMKGDCVNKY